MNLAGQQRGRLRDALINAFTTKAPLEQLLSFSLDKNLDGIAGGNNLQEIVFNLIKVAEAQGWIEDLVRAARKENSGNPSLKAIAQELLTDPEVIIPAIPTEPLPKQIQPQKILILGAIPHGLRLDKEMREIRGAIERSTRRDFFEIKDRTAIRPKDIRRAIKEERPQIVHFCGHGMEDGSLVLEDDGGGDIFVPPEGLAELFELHKNYVNCVVLNACHSAIAAKAIVQHINYVIGMNKPIGDTSAILFAEGFYDGLGYENLDNESLFERAFKEGKLAVALQYPKEKETLVLEVKTKV